MKIFLFIQDEPFYLYKYLPKLLSNYQVIAAVVLPQRLPADNIFKTVKRYLCLFGPKVFCQIAVKVFIRKITRKGSISDLLSNHGVSLLQPGDINSDNFIEKVKAHNPDLFISIACPQILREGLLAVPLLGGINLHGGYLPDYPGVFTPFWNLFHDSKFAGCSIHWINSKIDGGNIIARKLIPIENGDSVFSLYEKISNNGMELLVQVLAKIAENNAPLVVDPRPRGFYHSFPTWNQGKEFRRRGFQIL